MNPTPQPSPEVTAHATDAQPPPDASGTPLVDAIPRRGAFHHYIVDDVLEVARTLELSNTALRADLAKLTAKNAELVIKRAELADIHERLARVTAERDEEKKANAAMGRFLDHLRVRFSQQIREAWKPHDDQIDFIAGIMKKKLNELAGVQAELDAFKAAQSASRWQPISSAPKDGTHFIGTWEYSGRWITRIGKYAIKRFVEMPSHLSAPFTHWQPLPTPPL